MRTSTRKACILFASAAAAALAGCRSNEVILAGPPAPVVVTSAGQTTEADELAVFHHRNHDGVIRLIDVSLGELNLSPEQRDTLQRLKANLLSTMLPAREASRNLSYMLADGVALGMVDDAKANGAVARVGEENARVHQAILLALDELHRILTPEQRTALMESMQVRWTRWEETKEATLPHQAGITPPGDIAVLKEALGLSQDQVDRILARFQSSMHGVLLDYHPQDVEARMQAFASAFTGPSFDARALPTGQPVAAAPAASFGATRMTRFFEAFAPELTPAQRLALAQMIRNHANRHESP